MQSAGGYSLRQAGVGTPSTAAKVENPLPPFEQDAQIDYGRSAPVPWRAPSAWSYALGFRADSNVRELLRPGRAHSGSSGTLKDFDFCSEGDRLVQVMNAALDFDDLTRLSQGPLDAMGMLGASLEPGDQGSREAFSRQVAAVQALLKQTYQAAALLARRSADCEESARIWKSMGDYANQVLVLLSLLKDRNPQCGTAELHDLALDYKAAADKRYQADLEATLCQKTPLPDGLLPPLTSLV